jgi:hypothetical protein
MSSLVGWYSDTVMLNSSTSWGGGASVGCTSSESGAGPKSQAGSEIVSAGSLGLEKDVEE